MTAPDKSDTTGPTLEEQIAEQTMNVPRCEDGVLTPSFKMESAILASLRHYQSIMSAELPVEPDAVKRRRITSVVEESAVMKYIDSLKLCIQNRDVENKTALDNAKKYMVSLSETVNQQAAELAALRGNILKWRDFWQHYSSLNEGSQDDINDERHATIEAMSAVILKEGK